jgi:Protein of unknown function (DUF3034)
MTMRKLQRHLLCAALLGLSCTTQAQEKNAFETGGKLLLTGGVSQLEGAAGGGLTPWAVIGGYGTDDEIGANVFYTRVNSDDYHLDDAGLTLGFYNRVELSFAQQRFNTENVGGLLGLGNGFSFKQNIMGIKVRLAGDLVVDSDRAMPQISIGVQHKKNNQSGVLAFIGAKDDSGTDVYLTATKLLLADGVLLNGTLRFTKANQIGILGFGGDKNNSYQAQLEVSAAYLLNQKLAVGLEYRMKPNNLGIAKEDNWLDAFIAYAPNKHVSFTLAYADLGNIVIKDNQRSLYFSTQIGF